MSKQIKARNCWGWGLLTGVLFADGLATLNGFLLLAAVGSALLSWWLFKEAA